MSSPWDVGRGITARQLHRIWAVGVAPVGSPKGMVRRTNGFEHGKGRTMRRIVVSLLKGGVAKSETAVSLAHGLARQGCRVLLVDTDVQAQCNDMLGVEPEQGLAEVIAGWAEPLEALAEARENLWLLAGGVPLAGVKMEIARREMAPEAVLDETLAEYEGHFDVMVMDTAPGWDTLLVNALYCSREVISPVSMEPVALKGLRRFEERLSVIQKYNPALELKWVVPTFVDGRVRKTAHIMEQLRAEFGPRLTDPIRYSVKLSEAPEHGKTIFEHDPRGAGAKGYQALVERVLREAPAGEELVLPREENPQAAPAGAIQVSHPPEPLPEPEPREAPVTEQVARPEAPAEPEPAQSVEAVGEPSPDPQPWELPASAWPVPPEPEDEPEPLTPAAKREPMEELPSQAPAPEPATAPPAAMSLLSDAPELTQEHAAHVSAMTSLAARLRQNQEPGSGSVRQGGDRPGMAPSPAANDLSAPAAGDGADPEASRKVWDLRQRLKKVPILSQRLKRGLGSGSS